MRIKHKNKMPKHLVLIIYIYMMEDNTMGDKMTKPAEESFDILIITVNDTLIFETSSLLKRSSSLVPCFLITFCREV